MREKLHAAHPNRSGLFDVKHDRGGMIDIEFSVQFLVLGFSHRFPSLTANLGNIALLRIAAGHGLIPDEPAERCRDAYRESSPCSKSSAERRAVRARAGGAGRAPRRGGARAVAAVFGARAA